MPVIIVNGIVTRYSDYKDYDRILSIFTTEMGRVDAKARGCRRTTSALLPAAQPFVFGEFELYTNHDKFSINQVEIKESFFPIREDIDRFALGSAMLRLTQEAVQENEPNDPLFSLLYHALSYLAYGKAEPIDLFLCFLIRFLNMAGYCPTIVTCAKCGRDLRSDAHFRFSSQYGGAVCTACGFGAKEVSKITLELMRRMLILTDDKMDAVVLKPEQRNELIPILTDYAEYALEYGGRGLTFAKQFLDTKK